VKGPRSELPIEDEQDSYADDDDGETRPRPRIRPRTGVLGRRPAVADGTADHEGECHSKGRRIPAHGQTRYRGDDSIQADMLPSGLLFC
jgi:hypothetical protein